MREASERGKGRCGDLPLAVAMLAAITIMTVIGLEVRKEFILGV